MPSLTIPDKFLDLMNPVRTEMGDEPYKWHVKWRRDLGASGRTTILSADVNANNEITAQDMSILAYHIVNDLPEMFRYTKQAHTTIMEGTPYEQSYDNLTLPSKVENSPLKGTDGLKTGFSPAFTTTPRQPSRGETADYQVVGLGTTMWNNRKLPQSKSEYLG